MMAFSPNGEHPDGSRAPAPTGTIGAPAEHLDLSTMLKVSQALSGELVHEKLLEILMRTALEQAGAERGVLALPRWSELRIAAQANTGGNGIVVTLHDEAMTAALLPESVIQHVVRANESVILDDATARNPFSADPYIRQHHARSILCMPLLNQGQLMGVLYLENKLTPGVFAPARIAVLKLLASQAAMSLENTRLYRDLAEREAKSRRLVEAQTSQAEDELRAIIDNAPVFLWSDLPDGYCDFLNQRWLTYFNLSLQEARGAGWAKLLHPDDAAHHLESWQKSVSTGIPFETEARYRRPDGEYRWFLNRANPLRDKTGRIVRWYGTNIDIENLKRTEGRLRQSEAYLAEAQRLSHTGTWAFNATTTLYWSEESYRIWGLDPLQGLPNQDTLWQRIHPDDRDRVYKETQEALQQKRDYEGAFRIVLPDGTIKYLEALGHYVFSAHGELVEVIGTNVDVTERKRAEEALRESEAKIRHLVDANIIGIIIWDFEGRIIEANDAFLRMVRYDHEDLVAGRIRWTDLTPAEWRDRSERGLAELRSTGTFQPFEKEYFRKDGSRMPVLIGGALFEETGNEGVAFVLDLTERKRAEEALRESAEALRRSETNLAEAQRLSHIGSWALSPGMSKILHWSEECYRIWGFDPMQGLPNREIVGQRIHPDDRGGVYEKVQKALQDKSDYEVDFRIVLPDGTVKYVEAIGHHLFSAHGDLVEVVGTNVDVTERKRAEEALRESEARFRDYAETASDWFWEIGPDYKFTQLTENAFGSDPAERIGTVCSDHALDLETEPEKWRLLWATLDSRRPFRDFVYCSVGGNGSPMYVKASGKPVFDTNGEFRGYRGTGTDVTAIMRAQRTEESLRAVQAELAHVSRVNTFGELTASIAHEVKQPIAAARNNARAALNFLERQPPDLGEVRDALACVVSDADRAGDIVDGIRDFIKKAPPRKDRLDLNDAINEVIALARSAITENGVSVRTRLAEGLSPVQGDRVQLQQVVTNLILNAVEAMSSVEAGTRELSISTEQSQTGGVLVAVRDSGPGIDTEHLHRVFQAFYTTKSSGMGMGLAICSSIIDAHRGRLWAETNEPRGAAFQFTLPGAEKELTTSPQAAHQTGEPHEDTASDGSHQSACEDSQ